jgi:hypothetical protein
MEISFPWIPRKTRILIVIFSEVSSRKKLLMVFCLLKSESGDVLPSTRRWRSELRKQNFGFLCDASWVKSREITIEILFFPSSEKNFPLPPCVAFNVVENSIHPCH